MTGKFKPHLDILPPAQKRLWPELKAMCKWHFSGRLALAVLVSLIARKMVYCR